MRRFQCFDHLRCHTQRLAKRQRAMQRRSLDVLHHEVIRPDVVQDADVRMVQRRNGLGLELEPLPVAAFERLYRDRPAQARVDGLVHLSHAASANQGDQFIWSKTCPRSECQAAGLYR